MKFRDYPQVTAYIFAQLPMYQRVGPAAYKADLKKTLQLDQYFEHPHSGFEAIHIAGTNGKGSVAHMLAAVCQAAGMKTGLYTSPHLKDFTERIRINGRPIPKDEVLYFFNEHYPVFEQVQPSFFEMSVMLAFQYFKQENVDIAIIETGLGGRLDSTNIIIPRLAVITNIGIDHTRFLGNTLERIAGEKAGIIKENIPVVVGEVHPKTGPVFEKVSSARHAPLYIAADRYHIPYGFMDAHGNQVVNVYAGETLKLEKLKVDLAGIYQQKNLVTTLQALDVVAEQGLVFSETQIRQGLASVRASTGLRGRWEILQQHPLVVADTAHNFMGLSNVLEQVKHTPHRVLFFVLGFVDDKALDDIISLFPADAHYYFTRADVPRAMDAAAVAGFFRERGIGGTMIGNPAEALAAATRQAGTEDLVYVGGSTFVVAGVLE